MGTGRGPLACGALIAAMAGCALISGVGDLDPSLTEDDPADSSTTSTGDGATSEGGSDTGAVDVATDPDTSTRLKNITFENGVLVHPETGGDRAVGDAGLSLLTKDANIDESGDATALVAIGGDFSLHVGSPAFVEETFGALDEIYIVVRLRRDAPATTTVPVIRILPEAGSTPIDIRLHATQRLSASLGAQIGAASNVLDVGKVYRVGIYVKKGKNANGTLQVSLAEDAAAFAAPFASSTNIDFERPEKLQLGLAASAASVTFDDVKIDSAQLAP